MNATVAKGFNAVILTLQRLGIVFGPMRVLTVTGRKSGVPRATPVAVQDLGGNEYVWQAFPNAAWVANVRAADTVDLGHGRRHRTVRFVDVPVSERRQLLLDLAGQMAKVHRDRMVTNGLAADNTPEAIAAAADRIAVFRVEDAGSA
jgi:deazaflavin-dependent oxidoreductase (nitroreductase family)